MAIEFKKVSIENRMMSVVSYESFCKNKEINNNQLTAVEMGDLVYPVRSKNDTKPGLYNYGVVDFFVDPPEEERGIYSSENVKDPTKTKTVEEFVEKINEIKNMERGILTTPDSISVPEISPKDSPLMKGLKEAIISKEIDLNKYQDRFGRASFPNDKRQLKANDITLFMLNRFTKALDLKGTLILEDAGDDVPNPMKKKIIIDLDGYAKNSEEESK